MRMYHGPNLRHTIGEYSCSNSAGLPELNLNQKEKNELRESLSQEHCVFVKGLLQAAPYLAATQKMPFSCTDLQGSFNSLMVLKKKKIMAFIYLLWQAAGWTVHATE